MPRRAPTLLLAALLLSSVGGQASAAATARAAEPTRPLVMHQLADNGGPVSADGRWVGLPSTPQAPGAARDDTTGRLVAYPSAECPPDLQRGLAPQGGLALIPCGGFSYRVLDLATGQLTPTPERGNSVPIGQLGRQWLLYGIDLGYVWVNWHTGEQRPATSGARGVPRRDSDSPDLGPFRPVVSGTTVLRPDWRAVEFAGGRLKAQRLSVRVGSRTVQLARRCRGGGCRSVQYVAGVVTWAEGTTVHAYVVRTGHRFSWKPTAAQRRLFAYSPGDGRVATVTHTAERLYVYWRRKRKTLPPNTSRGLVSYEGRLPSR